MFCYGKRGTSGGREASSQNDNNIIKGSAYEGKTFFRGACAAMAAGLVAAAVLAAAPPKRPDAVSFSLENVKSASYMEEVTEAYGFRSEESTVAPIRVKEADEVDKAVKKLLALDESSRVGVRGVKKDLLSSVSVFAEGELDGIFEARRIEEEKKAAEEAEAARRAAQRVYSTNYNVVGMNTSGIPMSQKVPSVPIELDENGVPVHYAYCIQGHATAYYGDTITATGTVPVQGTVAVDPRVIPYGTRLYITSADGRYVYGYAVAEDTGGFIYFRNGATVDLFMHSYDDCCEWGWRMANIYVLN